MGGRAVYPALLQRRDIHPVQGVRVPGAEDVFHVQPPLFRRRADPAHKAGFPRARPAFDDVQPVALPGGKTAVQGGKAVPAVRAQKIADLHSFHPVFLRYTNLCFCFVD